MSWIFDSEVLAVLTAVIIVSSVFAIVQAFNANGVVEPFSELGLLGPDGKIGNYPKQVIAGSPFQLNVYIGNHEGKTMYYKILVKLGDKSSIINATSFLEAQPIMELQAVLMHNSSIMIPVNITLYKAATQVRLIFEMWIFNESTNAFSYYGRWNQLWLNVTSPLFEVQSQKSLALNQEMEGKIIEGYFAIRRAERAGGDVSKMVELLNNAIKLAFMGRESEVDAIIIQIKSMEPEVSRLGLENERIRFYTIMATSIGVFALGIGAFLFLRNRIWNYWAKFYKDWLAIWKGENSKLDGIEKALRDYIKSKRGISVESIVFNWGIKTGSHKVAKALYKLARNGAVKLIDPKPPKSFSQYFFSKYNLGFTLITLIIALCILSISFSFSPARIVLGSIFVLFLPGYALVEALYPDEKDLTPLERLALSIGLSLALVPIVGLFLNYTPWGIRLNSILISLSSLCLGLIFLSVYRKFQLLTIKVSTHE